MLPAADPYAGVYVLIGSTDESAEIRLLPLPDGRLGAAAYFVVGLALRGLSREFGPNLGQMEFMGEMVEADLLRWS